MIIIILNINIKINIITKKLIKNENFLIIYNFQLEFIFYISHNNFFTNFNKNVKITIN